MLVDNDEQLETFLGKWSNAAWLAIDTEFVRERTYYPKLCLIQISDGEEPAVIDVLAIRNPGPLFSLLERRETVKVFHAASQDLEIFAQLRGQVPQPVFDTQIAATMLGENDQLGYAALVDRRLGVILDKSLTRTDWSRRPLHADEIRYAEDDVRHLATLYAQLVNELSTIGRLEWLQNECARYTDPLQYRTDPAVAWKRLRMLSRLPEAAQSVAVGLAAWREQAAIKTNRPRKWILPDDVLYRIAERRPDSLEMLGEITSFSPKLLARIGPSLLRVLTETDPIPFTLKDTPPLTSDQKHRLSKLRKQIDGASCRLNLPASFLATRSEMERIVRGESDAGAVRLFHGWRRQAAPEFLDWLDPIAMPVISDNHSRKQSRGF